jgi:N-carbamoylputrescine amidase
MLPSPQTFKLALHQLAANPTGADRLEHAIASVREAASRGAQICVLPELFRSPYFCQEMEPRHFDLAEPIPGPATERLAALAGELGVVIVASLFERAMPGLYYNTTAILDADGTLLGTYRKAHIPDDPLYCEKFYFAPGDSDFPVFQTRFAKLGVLICWDQWYPEAARICALKGAELLVYPTAIGRIASEPPDEQARQLDAWQTVQRGHAIANGLYVAAVNRVGVEAGIDFWGHTFCAGPQGEWLAEADDQQETTLLVECDLTRLADVRNIWPFFRDRRIDAYAGLTARQLPAHTKAKP